MPTFSAPSTHTCTDVYALYHTHIIHAHTCSAILTTAHSTSTSHYIATTFALLHACKHTYTITRNLWCTDTQIYTTVLNSGQLNKWGHRNNKPIVPDRSDLCVKGSPHCMYMCVLVCYLHTPDTHTHTHMYVLLPYSSPCIDDCSFCM